MSEDRILKAVVATIQEKKGDRPVILDLREVSIITDYFVVAGGQNPVHLKALADAVEKRLKEMGVLPQRIEGYREGGWILMDYGLSSSTCWGRKNATSTAWSICGTGRRLLSRQWLDNRSLLGYTYLDSFKTDEEE